MATLSHLVSLVIVFFFLLTGAVSVEKARQTSTCEEVLAPDISDVTSCAVEPNTMKRKYGENMIQNSRPVMYIVEESDNVPFACLLASGALPYCETSYGGVVGQTIKPSWNYRKVLPSGFEARGEIVQGIRIHTPGNANVVRADFPLWTRWYQEYRNVQIFRINRGEYKVDSASRERSAARIEAESAISWPASDTGMAWKRYTGTFTIIKANNSTIFQVFSSNIDWSVILDVDEDGVVRYVERRGIKKYPFGENVSALLRPFEVVVCDNGSVSEVFVDKVSMSDGIPYGGPNSTWPRPEGSKTHFRWGTYVTGLTRQKETNTAVDSLLFVAGSKVEEIYSRTCGPEF